MQTGTTFSLSSTTFKDGGAIPRRSTCDGDNVSPEISWSGAPDGTAAFAVIAIDLDAHDFVHWIAYDLTGSASGALPEGVSDSPDAPPQGQNSFGKVGYGGPCPPSGEHRYRITLYALDRMLQLTGTPRIQKVQDAMNGHVLDSAVITGTYKRG